jgi:hypothetical protein
MYNIFFDDPVLCCFLIARSDQHSPCRFAGATRECAPSTAKTLGHTNDSPESMRNTDVYIAPFDETGKLLLLPD